MDFKTGELYHYGVLGMKWGVRRYQNYDGSLTKEGVRRLERKAVQKNYKKERKNGGSFIFKSFRRGTGDNYRKAELDFYNRLEKDSKYKELSRKAFDAEKKRLIGQKKYGVNTKEGIRLEKESVNAGKAKNKYVEDLIVQFVNTELKDAKIKDLGITEHIDVAKKYLSSNSDIWGIWYWDENLEYNPDTFYESWIDKERFKG